MCGRSVSLRVGVVVLLLLCSGCLSGMSTDTNGNGDPTATGSPTACSGNETRPAFDLGDGSIPSTTSGFELTANRSTVARGDPITFTLDNVAGEDRSTGTHAKYVLQRRAESDWTTVTLFREGRTGFNATAVVHEPGTGFEWSFRASAVGFSTGKYVVCDRLASGEYRFVYGRERPVAVTFEVVERP